MGEVGGGKGEERVGIKQTEMTWTNQKRLCHRHFLTIKQISRGLSPTLPSPLQGEGSNGKLVFEHERTEQLGKQTLKAKV